MFKKLNKKGFTLAELLVVVAIIGVLVAVSIPIFSSQLEKAREATDAANIRAAYAELSADALTGEAVTSKTEGKITINEAAANATSYTATIVLTQQQADWQSASLKGSKIGAADAGTPTAGGHATLTVNSDGTATIAYAEK